MVAQPTRAPAAIALARVAAAPHRARMRSALGLVLLLASCRACTTPPKPAPPESRTGLPAGLVARLDGSDLDEQRFGELCIEAIHVAYPDARVTPVDALNFRLERPDLDLISFENPWRASPGGRARAVWDQVSSIRAVLGQFDEPGLESQIVPLVRADVGLPEGFDAGGQTVEGRGEPWVADLRLVYMFNRPKLFSPVTEDDLTRLKLSHEKLLELALGNLRALLPSPQKTRILNPLEGRVTEPRIWMVTLPGTGGYFESSLLLLDEVWAGLEKELGSGLVVAVPARDLLFVTRADNAEDVRRLRALAADLVRHADHPVSATLLARVNGGWQLLE